MTDFNDRRRSFESSYSYDSELRFKVEARASKLIGLWAAEQMGLDNEAAELYAREVVSANLEEPGFDDVKRKVQGDFVKQGVEVSDHTLDVQIEEANEQAKTQIMEEGA